MTRPTVLVSSRISVRRKAGIEWLAARSGLAEALVVGETLSAPHDLILGALDATGDAGTAGWRRITLSLLASELAGATLHLAGLTPGGGLARDAIVARTLLRLDPGRLGRLAAVSDTPGFGRAVGSALDDLRMAGATPEDLGGLDPALAVLAGEVANEWAAAGLADRARTLEAATEAARDPALRHYLLDRSTLLYDVRISNRREADLVDALLARAPEAMVTVPAGDTSTLRACQTLRFVMFEEGSAGEGASDRALARLQTHLFEAPPPLAESDGSVTVFSAPGESRECVEIARRLMARASAGQGFDGAAILLRQPDDYRPYLEEALGRADIPAYYARGVRRPDPAGRAFRSLLLCKEDDYSALRFAEYLSIGEVPDATATNEPPAALPTEDRWVAPEDGPSAEGAPDQGLADRSLADLSDSETGEAVRAHTLRVPRRWERLLVEASVVGGRERWVRRLEGLRAELELRRAGIDSEEVDDPRIARVERSLEDLEYFQEYALPLLDELDGLPDSATWSEWLDRLGGLATRAIRHPHTVLATLAELSPMGPIGPVTLTEVVRTLGPRLLELSAPPGGSRYGKVFVGPIDAARGLSFDVVFIPGMAERVFPPKIGEDPILLDHVREALNDKSAYEGPGLVTNLERVAAERLALRLAVGAATEQVVLSYPRIEAVKSRPRVPSFYMLEAVRAAEGALPSFEDLAKRAEDVSEARIGWPAPNEASRAIDEAEYDLAVLADLGVRGDEAVKAAGHLLHTNTHLARALRFRAYRWEVPRWTWADGLVDLSEGAAAALAEEAPDVRPFSATALQNFAACPYRFYLYTIQRLSPREEPIGIEALDPLQRGSLVHQVQFELLTRLQEESAQAVRAGRPALLPVRPDNEDTALAILDEVLDKVASDFEDRLVPAIERVWIDGIELIRQDLRQWLHRESLDPSPFEPYRFELSFGLPPDPDRDAHSVSDPVDLGVGLRLRGAIDLIERTPEGVMRVTDHKTGRYRAKRNAVIQGGELLQPVLYGLAAQQLFPDSHVQSGRLYYCTADGEYRTHEVEINEHTTGGARVLSDVLGQAYRAGAFQALPRKGACDWCDYRTVCGPDEERRVRRKPAPVELKRLREFQ
jgi:ATP-dependent helicase/nuclease subunit B